MAQSTPEAERNPLTHMLGSDGWKPMKAETDPVAEGEFKAAQKLFQEGKITEAEQAFKDMAKRRKGTHWGEKAQWYLAESLYQRNKLLSALDAYDLLKKDYPGTEYNEKLIKREWAIAQVWLAQYDPKTPPDQKFPRAAWYDGRMPFLDGHGHALRALEHVRQYNPQGELADDAVLRIADEHMNRADFDAAAMYYDQLIVDHPKSPFLQRAQLSSIDARMKAYLGPEYDASGLEKARELVKQTMTTFPDRAIGNDKLYRTLDLISDQYAEKDFVTAAYYKRAGYPTSAEFYFAKVAQKYPKSPWAVKAKTELASLAKVPRKIHDPSKIMTSPGSGGSNSMGGMNGGGMGGGGMGGGGMGMGGMGMGGMGMN